MTERITLSHGAGGSITRDLVENVFLPAFGSDPLSKLDDSAVLDLPAGRTAFTTDSFVVKPHFFPGGDIGRIAVCGTVNDLAVCGAKPLYLALGLIIEEGFEIETLRRIVSSIAKSAGEAGVKVAAGDTKVVERGAADGIFITSTGIGIVPEGVDLGAHRIEAGDSVIVSGTLGDHGIAVLSVREGLEFGSGILSDVAPLDSLAAATMAAGEVHAMRDATRGGAAAVLNELAGNSRKGVEIEEDKIPVAPAVLGACGLYGLDHLALANEGKIVAFVSRRSAEKVVGAMRSHPLGRNAAVVGKVCAEHPGMVVLNTPIGGRKILEMPAGEGLPRIC